MANGPKKPAVTAAELEAAFNDWKKKDQRFVAIAKGKRELLEPVLDQAARAADEACEVVYKLLLRATRAKNDQTCIAVFPDGSHLIAVHEAGNEISEERVKLERVPASRVVHLS